MVNALIHEPAIEAESLSTNPVHLWITLWMTVPQPPIANISTLGRSDVEAERSSE